MVKIFFSAFLLISCFGYSKNDFEDLSTEINRKIKEQYGQSWEAKYNSIVEIYKDNPNIFSDIEDDFENVEKLLIEKKDLFRSAPKKTPPTLDWRNHAGQNWITPVKDQGQCGSCVAFALIGALETAFSIHGLNSELKLDLSEQYLFSCSGSSCKRGSRLSGPMKFLSRNGVPDEMTIPYLSGIAGEDISCSSLTQPFRKLYQIESYEKILVGISYFSYENTLESFKQALMEGGPFVVSISVNEDLLWYSKGIYRQIKGYKNIFRHAVLLVGYNDKEKYFIIKNSWGSWWGESGFFRYHYDNGFNTFLFPPFKITPKINQI